MSTNEPQGARPKTVLPRQEQLLIISRTLEMHGSCGDRLMSDVLKKRDDALRDVLIEIERRHATLCRKMLAERFETGINRRFVPLVIGEGRLDRFARDVVVRRSLIEVAVVDCFKPARNCPRPRRQRRSAARCSGQDGAGPARYIGQSVQISLAQLCVPSPSGKSFHEDHTTAICAKQFPLASVSVQG